MGVFSQTSCCHTRTRTVLDRLEVALAFFQGIKTQVVTGSHGNKSFLPPVIEWSDASTNLCFPSGPGMLMGSTSSVLGWILPQTRSPPPLKGSAFVREGRLEQLTLLKLYLRSSHVLSGFLFPPIGQGFPSKLLPYACPTPSHNAGSCICSAALCFPDSPLCFFWGYRSSRTLFFVTAELWHLFSPGERSWACIRCAKKDLPVPEDQGSANESHISSQESYFIICLFLSSAPASFQELKKYLNSFTSAWVENNIQITRRC